VATTTNTKNSDKVSNSDSQVITLKDGQIMTLQAYSRFMRLMHDLIVEGLPKNKVINKISFMFFGNGELDNFKTASRWLTKWQGDYLVYKDQEAAKLAAEVKQEMAASEKK
jgi:hypothetical protein